MKELTQCDIENLKAMTWEYRDARYPFIANNYDDATFYELSGFDLRPIKNVSDASEKTVYSVIAYTRPGVRDENNYCLHWYVSVDGSIVCDGTIASYPYDVLKLYEKLDKGDTVEEYFNDNLSEIVNKIKNTYPEVYNAIQNEEPKNTDLKSVVQETIDKLGEGAIIDFLDGNFPSILDTVREHYMDSLEASDIGDCLKEDIINEWFEDNSGEALDKAWDVADDYDLKDKIIDYLGDRL